MTFELARLARPGGFVTGVDMDEVKLGLAREAAVERGVSNVEFLAGNVNDWDEPGAYDVVYAGFCCSICASRWIFCAGCGPGSGPVAA